MDQNQTQQLNIKEAPGIQQQFFALLKNSMPPHVSMADELSEKMGLSYDSIYRRIRGEKALSMLELKMLCQQYNISLDQVLDIQNTTVVFNAPVPTYKRSGRGWPRRSSALTRANNSTKANGFVM